MHIKNLNTSENRAFSVLMLFTNAMNSTFFGYFIVYLVNSGYSESSLGLFLSFMVVFQMIAQALIGHLSDFVISIKKIMFVCIVLTTIFVAFFPVLKDVPVVMYLSLVVILVAGRNITNMMDTYINRVAAFKSGLSYTFVRGIGSMGYAIFAFSIGILIKYYGYNAIFVVHIVVAIISIISILFVDDVPVLKQEKKEKNSDDKIMVTFKKLMAQRGFLTATIASTFVFVGVSMVQNYFSVIVETQGGTGSDIGLGLFLMAASEIPIFWCYSLIRRKISENTIILFSFFMFCLRYTLVPMFFTVNGIVWFQLLQALSFGLFVPSMFSFMQKIIPDRIMGTGLMLWSGIYASFSGLIGLYGGGYMLEHFGPKLLYYVSASFAGIGFMFMLYTVIDIKKNGFDKSKMLITQETT